MPFDSIDQPAILARIFTHNGTRLLTLANVSPDALDVKIKMGVKMSVIQSSDGIEGTVDDSGSILSLSLPAYGCGWVQLQP